MYAFFFSAVVDSQSESCKGIDLALPGEFLFLQGHS